METKFKNEYRQKVINMIKVLLKEHPVSDDFVKLKYEEKFFEDSKNFVDLRYQLCQIQNALEIAIKYSDC